MELVQAEAARQLQARQAARFLQCMGVQLQQDCMRCEGLLQSWAVCAGPGRDRQAASCRQPGVREGRGGQCRQLAGGKMQGPEVQASSVRRSRRAAGGGRALFSGTSRVMAVRTPGRLGPQPAAATEAGPAGSLRLPGLRWRQRRLLRLRCPRGQALGRVDQLPVLLGIHLHLWQHEDRKDAKHCGAHTDLLH